MEDKGCLVALVAGTKSEEVIEALRHIPDKARDAVEEVAPTEKINGCFFKGLNDVRQGKTISLSINTTGCGGGEFYAGFTGMPPHVPNFVSLKEKYKKTPEMVLDFINQLKVKRAEKKYLNLARIDTIENFNEVEGIFFLATPDILSGLCTWAYFDNNAPDAVVSIFGSGCSATITQAVNENRKNGHLPKRKEQRYFSKSILICKKPMAYPTLFD